MFIKSYPVSVSQLPSLQCCAGQETCWWWPWSAPLTANAAVTPNTSEANHRSVVPRDPATSNLVSQVTEVKETVPAGAGILPRVNHLHIWDPFAGETDFIPLLKAWAGSCAPQSHEVSYQVLSSKTKNIKCFNFHTDLITLLLTILAGNNLSRDNRKKPTNDPQKDALPEQA